MPKRKRQHQHKPSRPTTRAGFALYVRAMADLMGLRDWTVCVGDDPPAKKHLMAEADCTYGRKYVAIELSDLFLDRPEAEQRATICHELVHAHLAAMHHYLHRTLGDGKWEAYLLTMEYAVDGIAESWAPRLPLPSQVAPAD